MEATKSKTSSKHSFKVSTASALGPAGKTFAVDVDVLMFTKKTSN